MEVSDLHFQGQLNIGTRVAMNWCGVPWKGIVVMTEEGVQQSDGNEPPPHLVKSKYLL